jgi:anti-sigma B factor antagonist
MSMPSSRRQTPSFGLREDALEDGTPVLAVRGDLDLFTAPEFRERLAACAEAGGGRVVVDFGAASFIDSSGAAALLQVRRLHRDDARLVIVNRDPGIARIFEVMGLDELFAIVPSREHALAALGPRRR